MFRSAVLNLLCSSMTLRSFLTERAIPSIRLLDEKGNLIQTAAEDNGEHYYYNIDV